MRLSLFITAFFALASCEFLTEKTGSIIDAEYAASFIVAVYYKGDIAPSDFKVEGVKTAYKVIWSASGLNIKHAGAKRVDLHVSPDLTEGDYVTVSAAASSSKSAFTVGPFLRGSVQR